MRFASTLVFCLLALAARAQGVLTFESTDHDFGKVPEGTMATYEFKFKNTGNQPIVIASAQASCGCTTPEWTKAPVMPGKSGVIKAVYNSAGRPGVFAKTVTVMSNATDSNKILSLKGTVLTKEELRATLTPAQLAASPRLVLERSSYDFGRIEVGQQSIARIGVRNNGPKDLVLSTLSSPCYCVGYRAAPAPIKPGQSVVVELVYAQRTVGAAAEEVKISSNDLHGDTKLTLKANVVKDLVPTSLVKESGSSVPFK
ncbi:DUF1573 domain-containing protein [Hymenobacter sp. HMF4947]|uniref:DUF1573 domain-containing protein n=1 Tax=Hymenobacter ginkgonis TaxID=2682976 RepID=A0A7K1TJZ3_9BACT|nr:DUF1573 domain-containing protein [Hymenobacter ginkgonis]MVN78724.1 DUF1573 domain-containing protein [Hymenobacter ginkgonis]